MKLEDASHADYVCIGLAPHCMNGCTPDAPIPVRTWVWTSIVTFGPVQTDLSTHLFIYLNLLTTYLCLRYSGAEKTKHKNNHLKTGATETPNF